MERAIRVQAELPYINKYIQWKVSSVFKGNQDPKFPNKPTLSVSRWTPPNSDSDYVIVRPNIGLTITIKTRQKEDFGIHNSIFMGYDKIVQFQSELSCILKMFYEVKGLFYLDKSRDGYTIVTINPELANKCERTFHSCGKVLKIKPSVVYDDDDPNATYEGIVMFLNTYDIYAHITKTELERMEHCLRTTDLMNLSFHLLESVKVFQ